MNNNRREVRAREIRDVGNYVSRDMATIADYAYTIGGIWKSDINSSPYHFWHYVMKHTSSACEAIRKSRWDQAVESLCEVIVWWLSFMNKITTKKATENDFTSLITFIDSDPDSIIWHKYPGFCPHCFGRRVYGLGLYSEKEKNKIIVRDDEVKKIIDDLKAKPKCTCLSEKLFIEGRNDPFKQFVSINVAVYAKEHPLDKPKSMNEFAEMFQHIYGDSVEAQTIEQITFHLLEETGEVATALTNLPRIHVKNLLNKKNKPTREQINEIVSTRRYYLRALAEELADVFSWINSLTIKLQRYLNCTSDLAETLHKKEAMARQIKELIERIVQEVHPVELIWRLHGEGDILVCEKCRKRPCECKPPREETLQHYIDIASEQGYNYVKRKLLTSDDILLKVLEDGSKIYDFSDVPNSDPSC